VTWYEARVTPIRYIGTPKYRDKYYKAVGTVMVKKKMFREEFGITRDTYSNVMLKESANEFYGKKLKELFGENYLSVLEVTGSYSDKSKNFEGSVKLTKEKGDRLYISGGIYIFGRVENDEDREWYRKQIYEFIQFMKETGTFEYVALTIEIIDERILFPDYQKIVLEIEKEITIKDREKILKKITSVEDRNIIIKKIDSLNRSKISDFSNKLLLLYTQVYSSKYIESNYLNREKKEYDKMDDIIFTIQWY
ncbi:hypothetical protein, partial [Fusobacterium varium]